MLLESSTSKCNSPNPNIGNLRVFQRKVGSEFHANRCFSLRRRKDSSSNTELCPVMWFIMYVYLEHLNSQSMRIDLPVLESIEVWKLITMSGRPVCSGATADAWLPKCLDSDVSATARKSREEMARGHQSILWDVWYWSLWIGVLDYDILAILGGIAHGNNTNRCRLHPTKGFWKLLRLAGVHHDDPDPKLAKPHGHGTTDDISAQLLVVEGLESIIINRTMASHCWPRQSILNYHK